ncbi:PREDICTED: uncharacterized protein LOC109487151 [Branchiostoma belcheri]|uniref:Uncharacterized protein LOC109487151 n=1 Tax=Branchiostoma belcheri TaxID=7741 RepID=A0A6P5AX99_BRABE|nr:PREDICTED: uncharacterized protein LOC109487151 [Branchiostoma belcheri]
MDERDVELLRDHQLYIVNNLRVGDIKSYLIEKKVCSSDMFEEIQMEPTRRQQVEKFLDLLVLRGPNAFGHFCDSLKADYNFLYEKLTTEYKRTPDHPLREENKRLQNDNKSKGRKVAELSKVLSFLYQTLENIEKELAEGVSYIEVIKLVKKGMKKLHKHLPPSRTQNKHSPKEKTVSTPNLQPEKGKNTSTTPVNESDIHKSKTEPQQLSRTSTRAETTERKPSQQDTGQDTKDKESADDLSTISSSTTSNHPSVETVTPKTDMHPGTSKVSTNQSIEGVKPKEDKLPSKSETESRTAPIVWKTGHHASETGSHLTTSQTKEPKENGKTKDKQERTGFTYTLVTSGSQGVSNKSVHHPYTGRRHSLQRTQIQPFGQVRVSGSKTSGGVFSHRSSFPVHAHQLTQVQAWRTREETRRDSPPTLVKGRYLPKSQSLPKL